MAKRPKTIIREFLNRVLFLSGPNSAETISLHHGTTNSPPLLSRAIEAIEDYKGNGLDELQEEFLSVINDDDDPEDDDEPFYLYAEMQNGDKVSSKPIKPKGGRGSEKELLTQAHRHIEVMARLNAGMVDSVMKHGTTQMYHARQMAEESFETRTRLLQTEQDLADRSHERLLEAKKEEQSAEFRQAIMAGVAACFPMLAGKIAGIMPLGAEAVRASPHYQTIKSIFEGVPEEHWPAMHAWLQSCPMGDAQKTALQHVIDSILHDMINEKKTNGEGPSVRH